MKICSSPIGHRIFGQSLIEILVGIAIGAIFVIGAAMAIAPSLQITKQVSQVQAKTELANELAGNVNAWAGGSWNNVLALATGTANTYHLNTASSPFTAVGSGAGGGGNSYVYDRAITISSSSLSGASGTLSNFPMLFSGTYHWLAASSSGGNVQNANGYDIIFAADAGCSNKLNFETESYTPSTGAIVDWVSIPTLAGGTVVYICYDNGSVATDQSDAAFTWNSNYVGVWHFPNGTALGTDDSTSNANALANNGAVAVSGSAPLDGAAGFNGTSAYLQNSNSGGQFDSNSFTWEAWVEPTYTNTGGVSPGIMGVRNGSSAKLSLHMGPTLKSLVLYNGSTLLLPAYTFTPNTWYHIVISYNAGFTTVYVNGASLGSSAYTIGASTLLPLNIGSSNGLQEFWIGNLDEIRISNTALSPSWIVTEYHNENSPDSFYTLGSSMTPGGDESITIGGATFTRSFYVSDVYRDSSGNVATSASGNNYDPSTKLITIVVSAVSANPGVPSTLSFYLTRNGSNNFSQTSWSGGAGQTNPVTLAGTTFASSSGITISATGSIQLVYNVNASLCY